MTPLLLACNNPSTHYIISVGLKSAIHVGHDGPITQGQVAKATLSHRW